MNAISTVCAVFLLLLVGYGARKIGVLKSSDISVVNSIVVNLTGPAFIFSAMYGRPVTAQMVSAPFVVFATTMLVLGAAYPAAKALKLDRRTTGGFMLAATFGNTAFMGYPVTIAAFPGKDQALATAVMIDQFSMSLPLYSIGIVIAASCASTRISGWHFLEFLKFPLFIAAIIAIALHNIQIPYAVMRTLHLLGAATVPLAMISLGLSLSRSSLKHATLPSVVALILKMAILPTLTYFMFRLIGGRGVVLNVSVLESSMPTAIMAGVIAGRYGANESFVSAATFLMTLFSLVSIPIILTILG